jgi:hypothetical protein
MLLPMKKNERTLCAQSMISFLYFFVSFFFSYHPFSSPTNKTSYQKRLLSFVTVKSSSKKRENAYWFNSKRSRMKRDGWIEDEFNCQQFAKKKSIE